MPVDQPLAPRWAAAVRWSPAGVAVLAGALYAVHAPPVPDLAAQTARGALFSRTGLTPYWTGWYGGVGTGGYSLLSPALLGWLGPAACGGLALAATGVLAVLLTRSSRRPTWGALALVGTAGLDVLAGRTTFALAVVAAVAALWAVTRGRVVAGGLLAVLTAVTSPVAALLLLVPAGAAVLAARRVRAAALAVVAGAVLPTAALALLFPTSGAQPFAGFVYRPAVLLAVAPALLPVGRVVRTGALLAGVATTAAFLVPSPMGSNVTRIALLAAVPATVACLRAPGLVTLVVAAVLSAWPVQQVRIDLAGSRSPAASPGFDAGLRQRLLADPLTRTSRVEVVDTTTHWTAARLPPEVVLARGWERQTDIARGPLFYGRTPLTAATYRAWLDRRAVSLVAVPQGAPLDFGAGAEDALVRGGLDYLTPVWRDAHWVLYRVRDPRPVVTGGRLVRFTDRGADVDVPRPGRVTVAMAWSPFLRVSDGRVLGGDDEHVVLDLRTAGTHRVRAAWGWPRGQSRPGATAQAPRP